MHGIRRAAKDQHAGDPRNHGKHRHHAERAAPVGKAQRESRDAEADCITRARAGDEVAHGAAAARPVDVLVDERERRRIGATLAKTGESVQPERRPEAVGEKDERPGAQAGGDAGREVGALRAEVIGDEADDEERGEVAEVERRLDHARLLRIQAPRGLRERQHRGIGDEPGGGEDPARAERSEPGSRAGAQAASRTGMRRLPKGFSNLPKRPLIGVPQYSQLPSGRTW